MRRPIILAAAAFLFAASAMAEDADGTVKQIDPEMRTILLDDGNTYLLPGEFDPAFLEEGSEIFFIFQVVDGVNVITDMEIMD